jgi:hypothetical protein
MKGIHWLETKMECFSELLVQRVEKKLACNFVIDLVIRVIESCESGSTVSAEYLEYSVSTEHIFVVSVGLGR